MCLGYRHETGCHRRTTKTQNSHNWIEWQLCYNCARRVHPEFYEGKKHHGVRTPEKNKTPIPIQGIENIEEEFSIISFIKNPKEFQMLRNIEA